MAIRKKSREELENQAKGFLDCASNRGKITRKQKRSLARVLGLNRPVNEGFNMWLWRKFGSKIDVSDKGEIERILKEKHIDINFDDLWKEYKKYLILKGTERHRDERVEIAKNFFVPYENVNPKLNEKMIDYIIDSRNISLKRLAIFLSSKMYRECSDVSDWDLDYLLCDLWEGLTTEEFNYMLNTLTFENVECFCMNKDHITIYNLKTLKVILENIDIFDKYFSLGYNIDSLTQFIVISKIDAHKYETLKKNINLVGENQFLVGYIEIFYDWLNKDLQEVINREKCLLLDNNHIFSPYSGYMDLSIEQRQYLDSIFDGFQFDLSNEQELLSKFGKMEKNVHGNILRFLKNYNVLRSELGFLSNEEFGKYYLYGYLWRNEDPEKLKNDIHTIKTLGFIKNEEIRQIVELGSFRNEYTGYHLTDVIDITKMYMEELNLSSSEILDIYNALFHDSEYTWRLNSIFEKYNSDDVDLYKKTDNIIKLVNLGLSNKAAIACQFTPMSVFDVLQDLGVSVGDINDIFDEYDVHELKTGKKFECFIQFLVTTNRNTNVSVQTRVESRIEMSEQLIKLLPPSKREYIVPLLKMIGDEGNQGIDISMHNFYTQKTFVDIDIITDNISMDDFIRFFELCNYFNNTSFDFSLERLRIMVEHTPNLDYDSLKSFKDLVLDYGVVPEILDERFDFLESMLIEPDEIKNYGYLIKFKGKLPGADEFKEGDYKGYLKYIEEIIGTNYNDDKKSQMIKKIVSLTFEEADKYLKIFQMFDESISMDVQRIKNELIDEILNSDNPEDVAEQINNIFERNNLPLTGKVFKVFELLYPKDKFKETLQSHGSPVLHKYLDEGKNVYSLIYKDLMNIAIKSGDRSLRDYLETFVESEGLLKKFEGIIKEDGFDKENEFCLEGKITEDEQERLLYLFRKISVLYNRYYGKEINEGDLIENIKPGKSNISDKQLVHIYNEIRKGFNLRDGNSIYDRLQTLLYVNGLNYHSATEVLEEMNRSKKYAHERGLQLYNDSNGGKINFPRQAFLKGIPEKDFSKIINRGVTCKEYLGGGDDGFAARSDCTPFDADGICVDSPTDWNDYGSINLVVDTTKSCIYDTKKQGISGYTKEKYELFETCGGSPAHYGIRTGIPMTEVDYIIYYGDFGGKNFDDMCYEIARNGYYIPVTDKNGDIKFTPEMYHRIRKGFNYMKYYDGFDVELKDGKYVSKESDNEVHKDLGNSEMRSLISENSPSNDRYSGFARENRELAENTIEWIKRILEERCGIRFNSKYDTSITGAEIHDSGSTGRGTDIPTKDVDLDFTLLLDAKDYKKIEEIRKAIHEEIGTQKSTDHYVQEGGNQIKSKINNIGKSEKRPNGVPLDLLILKKSQVIDYSSSDAMKEKLNYIAKNPETGAEDLDRVRTNVIIMKKLLKAKGCYKKPEGGISGIGVENWITQNHGNFVEALESFEQIAYGGEYKDGMKPIPLEKFKKSYPIYDAGENYKDGCNDNFVYKLEENGYNGTLEIIKLYRLEGIEGIRKLIGEYEAKKAAFIE